MNVSTTDGPAGERVEGDRIRLAIVGSRRFDDYGALERFVLARRRGIPVHVWSPEP